MDGTPKNCQEASWWVELFQRLNGRIFHDLLSPFSGIYTGVHLMKEQGMQEGMVDVLDQSSSLLKHKFDLMRNIFGPSNPLSAPLLLQLMEDVSQSNSCTFRLEHDSDLLRETFRPNASNQPSLQIVPQKALYLSKNMGTASCQKILLSCFLWGIWVRTTKKHIRVKESLEGVSMKVSGGIPFFLRSSCQAFALGKELETSQGGYGIEESPAGGQEALAFYLGVLSKTLKVPLVIDVPSWDPEDPSKAKEVTFSWPYRA